MYICIDIGGTAIKYGIIDETGTIKQHYQIDTDAQYGGSGILQKISTIITQFSQYDVYGVCISTAGMVDIQTGTILYAAPTIPDYTGTQIKQFVEQNYHIPCEVENDVNCAALAESVSGAAKHSKIAVCFTVGTGIGGAIVLDGKVFHGASNSACEIGYMHMFDTSFEQLGASSVLSKTVAQKKQSTPDIWNGIKIFEAAKNGDEICVKAIDDMVDILGRGIANICYVLNPDTVVLGGGIMAQKEYLCNKLEYALDTYLVPPIRKQTKLCFAVHENRAGMLGAYYHFQQMQSMKKREQYERI